MSTTDDLRYRGSRGDQDYRSTPGLFTDLFDQTIRLVSSEFALARAEASEKITQAVTGFTLIVGGAVFLIGAVNILLAAAVTALVEAGIAAPWSSLIVAAAAAVIGAILAWAGLSNLKTSRLAPRRTAEQIRRDAHFIKERIQ